MENVVKQCHVNVTLFLQVNHHHRQRDDQTKSQSWRLFKIKIEDQFSDAKWRWRHPSPELRQRTRARPDSKRERSFSASPGVDPDGARRPEVEQDRNPPAGDVLHRTPRDATHCRWVKLFVIKYVIKLVHFQVCSQSQTDYEKEKQFT